MYFILGIVAGLLGMFLNEFLDVSFEEDPLIYTVVFMSVVVTTMNIVIPFLEHFNG